MLNYEFPPVGGGAGSATQYMSGELVRLGWEVVVLTSGYPGCRRVEYRQGVEIHRVPSLRRSAHDAGLVGAMTYLLGARRELGRLLAEREFDLAHFYFSLPTGLLARFWQERTGKPYIVSLRGSDVPNYDGSLMLRVFHQLLMGRNREILSEAQSVVANSAALRALALQSFPDQRIDVVTNGVCTRDYRPAKPLRRDGALQVICVARLIKRKGLEDALHALAATTSRAVQLHLVGLGPQMHSMARLASELGVAGQVVFRGHLIGDDLARAYREADAFLLPSLSESFSMALLEAMASGLPVIATNVGGIPELVEHGVNGLLVPPRDPAALAAALDTFAADPDLCTRFGRANRAKIEHEYTWSLIARRYVERFYTECAAKAAE